MGCFCYFFLKSYTYCTKCGPAAVCVDIFLAFRGTRGPDIAKNAKILSFQWKMVILWVRALRMPILLNFYKNGSLHGFKQNLSPRNSRTLASRPYSPAEFCFIFSQKWGCQDPSLSGGTRTTLRVIGEEGGRGGATGCMLHRYVHSYISLRSKPIAVASEASRPSS